MTIGELIKFDTYTAKWYNAGDPFVFASKPGYFQGPGFWNTWFGVADNNSSSTFLVGALRQSPNIGHDRELSYNDCRDNEQSFYWDNSNQILYNHVNHNAFPNDVTFIYGIVYGFSDFGAALYIDDIFYDPRITNNISFRQQQDLIGYSKPSFVTGTQVLSNSDGELDVLLDDNIYGNEYDLYYLDDTIVTPSRTDFQQLQKFIVEKYETKLAEFILNLKDVRQSQERQVPDGLFLLADYADLNEEDINTVIPLLFGSVRESPAIPTNYDTLSGDVEYRQATTLTTLGTVYVKVDETWTAVTPSATSVSTGEFTLSTGDGRDASGTPLECKVVNSTGITVTYASDIIKYLNTNYLGLTYSDSYYDTTEWEAEEVSLSPVGYVINEKKLISDIAVELQEGSNTGFRYETNQNGKRTIRIDNEGRSITRDFSNIDILDVDLLRVQRDPKNLLAEVRVKYAKSWQSNRFLSVYDDSIADTVEEDYKQRPYKEFETYLVDSTAANAKISYLQDRFSTVRGIFTGTIMGADNLDIRIYDLITVAITPGTVDFDAEVITGREYYGLKLCKVLSVDPDLQNKNNTISAVIIGNAEYVSQFSWYDDTPAEFYDGDTWIMNRY